MRPSCVERERAAGYDETSAYVEFARRVEAAKRQTLSFLIDLKAQGKTIAGYGAPAKGNTLLNYCGIRTDFLDFTVDVSPHKQGHYLPGSHIPIRSPDGAARGEARRRADPAVEPERRDHGGPRVHRRMGRALRGARPGPAPLDVIIEPTPLAGAWVIEVERREDERGWFARTFDAEEFAARGMEPLVAQCNASFNAAAGTLRGMHFQRAPHEEPKLVRCTRGADLRRDRRPAAGVRRPSAAGTAPS